MTTSQKAALSLLIAILLCGAFSALAYTGLFDLLETRFYNPSATAHLSRDITQIILLVSFFLTTYLIIFLLFNFRQDPLTVVQNRLKRLQISLIEQFYERKTEADWARWIRELESRREEIRALLKRGIKTDSSNENGEMDILINRSWDELLEILGSRRNPPVPQELDEEKIASILNKLLAARTNASAPSPAPLSAPSPAPTPPTPQAPVVTPVGVAPTGAGKTGLLKKASLIASSVAPANGEAKTRPPFSPADVDRLALKVEFNPDIKPETKDDESFSEDLEIVSPFSTMLLDFSPTNKDTGEEDQMKRKQNKNESQENELNAEMAENRGLPIITTPFGMSNSTNIETLETFAGKEKHISGDGNIIQEREGVPYISEDALAPENDTTLNGDFKKLVDDVTK